ncbi:type II secretion system minor pseudopilin GspK [Methylomonas sp. LL1]|uniref:type II secretion system minor pseudopilin GspK n=1 Tax=Methylomonas sp. LL1 TaxID=2785785 RepID=UPI0018C447E9|nr:type II secretion system minor pseudopilin GspK [Methylomonas sp. LL1]QPK64726.1 type II secretion system minor pseudopilin GspK [Methylomonas sp. LL1]
MAKLPAERGIALITVMLVLSIATLAVVSMSTARQMDIRRTENQLRAMQAWEYVYGLESWATNVLRTDGKDNERDALNESWAKPLPKTAVAQGSLQAEIVDLQGRINLNNLVVDGEVSQEDVKRLRRLLHSLELKPELVDAMLDWIDGDMEIRYPHGAEDEAYTRRKPPYRAANRSFADVSELLLVQGMSLEQYRKLLPYIYVTFGYAPLNVNTAGATVLRCLADDISADQAESIFRAGGKPFTDIADFLKDEAVSATIIGKYGLAVTSQYFLLTGQIEMGQTRFMFESQLQRSRQGLVTLQKRQRRSPAHG